MIERSILADFNDSLGFFPVISIIGPRQAGKTTLAKCIMNQIDKPTLYLDLEIQ